MSNSRGNNGRGNNGICDLLANLPPQYPVNEIVVDGFNEDVNAFITLDQDSDLAYFSEGGGGLVVADCRKISLVDFPSV